MFVLSYAWGVCAACSPVSQPQADPHACCKRAKTAHCGESAPEPAKHSTCPHEKRALAAYDRTATEDDAQLVALASVPVLALIAEPIAVEGTRHAEAAVCSHAPPELFVLNSTFRI